MTFSDCKTRSIIFISAIILAFGNSAHSRPLHPAHRNLFGIAKRHHQNAISATDDEKYINLLPRDLSTLPVTMCEVEDQPSYSVLFKNPISGDVVTAPGRIGSHANQFCAEHGKTLLDLTASNFVNATVDLMNTVGSFGQAYINSYSDDYTDLRAKRCLVLTLISDSPGAAVTTNDCSQCLPVICGSTTGPAVDIPDYTCPAQYSVRIVSPRSSGFVVVNPGATGNRANEECKTIGSQLQFNTSVNIAQISHSNFFAASADIYDAIGAWGKAYIGSINGNLPSANKCLVLALHNHIPGGTVLVEDCNVCLPVLCQVEANAVLTVGGSEVASEVVTTITLAPTTTALVDVVTIFVTSTVTVGAPTETSTESASGVETALTTTIKQPTTVATTTLDGSGPKTVYVTITVWEIEVPTTFYTEPVFPLETSTSEETLEPSSTVDSTDNTIIVTSIVVETIFESTVIAVTPTSTETLISPTSIPPTPLTIVDTIIFESIVPEPPKSISSSNDSIITIVDTIFIESIIPISTPTSSSVTTSVDSVITIVDTIFIESIIPISTPTSRLNSSVTRPLESVITIVDTIFIESIVPISTPTSSLVESSSSVTGSLESTITAVDTISIESALPATSSVIDTSSETESLASDMITMIEQPSSIEFTATKLDITTSSIASLPPTFETIIDTFIVETDIPAPSATSSPLTQSDNQTAFTTLELESSSVTTAPPSTSLSASQNSTSVESSMVTSMSSASIPVPSPGYFNCNNNTQAALTECSNPSYSEIFKVYSPGRRAAEANRLCTENNGKLAWPATGLFRAAALSTKYCLGNDSRVWVQGYDNPDQRCMALVIREGIYVGFIPNDCQECLPVLCTSLNHTSTALTTTTPS